jgi:serine/threonine protein kinase
LTTAILKLRKAFGGSRDSIILNVAGIGYRLAVPVSCREVATDSEFSLAISPGVPVPGREQWLAVKPLGLEPRFSVWLASNSRTGEQHVFTFATDDRGLRAIQRKVTISRLLTESDPESRFEIPYEWNFTQKPYYVESPFYGSSLIELSRGKTLKALDLEGRVKLAAQVAEALAKAHSMGVLHNNLRPEKVLVSDKGKVTVTDFSVSADLPDGLDGAPLSGVSDTRMYKAPGSSNGTTQNDTYAFGVLLYQLICVDFSALPLPGWEENVPSPKLREAIATTANVHFSRQTSLAAIAEKLKTPQKPNAGGW